MNKSASFFLKLVLPPFRWKVFEITFVSYKLTYMVFPWQVRWLRLSTSTEGGLRFDPWSGKLRFCMLLDTGKKKGVMHNRKLCVSVLPTRSKVGTARPPPVAFCWCRFWRGPLPCPVTCTATRSGPSCSSHSTLAACSRRAASTYLTVRDTPLPRAVPCTAPPHRQRCLPRHREGGQLFVGGKKKGPLDKGPAFNPDFFTQWLANPGQVT